MAFVRKRQDIFGLTLNDSIWRNQEKQEKPLNHSNDLFEQLPDQDLTSKNVSSVQQELKQDNSCFQYGFPSLFELNKIRQSSISLNQREMDSVFMQYSAGKLQKNKQYNSLFQYDLLFNQRINNEKSAKQSCPCCPPIDLSKTPREIQRQNDSVINKKDDDDISYIRSININLISEKKTSSNHNLFEVGKKSVNVNPLKDVVNNNSSLNKLTGGRLNGLNGLNGLNEPNKINPLLDLNNVTTKTVENVTKSEDKIVQSIPLKGQPVDVKLKKPGIVTVPKEKKAVHPLKNTNNNNNNNSNNNKNNNLNSLYKPKDNELKKFKSTLTVEKVQSILEFYHSTSEDFIIVEEKDQDSTSISYPSDDGKKDSLNNINFSDVNKVKSFKCSQCDREFSDKNSRKKHVRNDHKLVCKICNEVSYNVRQMQHHEEKFHETFFKKKSKRRGSGQTKRKRNPGNVRNYFCCGQHFKTGRELGIHKGTHKFIGKKDLSHKHKI